MHRFKYSDILESRVLLFTLVGISWLGLSGESSLFIFPGQYIFNASVEDRLGGARAALEKTPVAVEILKEGEGLIKDRQKQIKIAERSEFGWVTM